MQGFVGQPDGKSYLEDLDVGGELYETDTEEIGWDGVVCIDVAGERDKWRAFVNTVMNFHFK
jgi:hypothetical protein